jgi:hypothetical protein
LLSLCSPSFWYSRSLSLLAPVVHGMITYIEEPSEIGRRGCRGRCLTFWHPNFTFKF